MSEPTEALIERLAAELRPVRRLAAPGWRAAGWLLGAGLIIAAAVLCEGLRPDLAARMALPFEVWQWLASVLTGVLAAFAAFLTALPGRSPRWALLPLPALALWLSGLGWGCVADLSRLGPQAMAVDTSWSCLRFIVGLGLPLLGTLLWALRHGWPVRPVPVALLGALASAALCSAGLSLFHHLDAALMILLWHGGATALVIGLGGLAGAVLDRPGASGTGWRSGRDPRLAALRGGGSGAAGDRG